MKQNVVSLRGNPNGFPLQSHGKKFYLLKTFFVNMQNRPRKSAGGQSLPYKIRRKRYAETRAACGAKLTESHRLRQAYAEPLHVIVDLPRNAFRTAPVTPPFRSVVFPL